MNKDLGPNSPVKPYFLVRRPAHLQLRPDLPEELCVADSMTRLLPRTEQSHKAWLRICGHAAKKYPLAMMASLSNRPYEPTNRYVLQAVTLPGNVQHTNIITDGNLWSVVCEYKGLFQSVIDRAIELTVHLGVDPGAAQGMFVSPAGPKPAATRGHSRWAVGYERISGLGTILAAHRPGTIQTFLEGRSGYYTPFREPI
jgi:hypothetical protein